MTHPDVLVLQVLQQVFPELKCFQLFAGLRVDESKSALMPVGSWHPPEKKTRAEIWLPITSSYKYLGVMLGAVIPEEAFAPALQKALGPAYSV